MSKTETNDVSTSIRATSDHRRSALLVLALCAGLAWPAAEVQAQSAAVGPSAATASERQPPLIDRELFFGDPEIAGAQLSPDGTYLSFLKPYKGTRNIWVKRADAPFDSAKPVTADTRRPISGYFWSRDGRFVLFVQDQGGDENFNVYAVNPADQPLADTGVPPARNLTDAKGATAFIYAVPRKDADTLWVGLNDRDRAWHDLYRVSLSTGERTLERRNTDRITGWIFDLDNRLRLATRAAENGDTEVLRVEGESLKKVYSCNVFETCQPVRFHKDGKRVYMITNKGAGIDLIQLVLFDPATGQEELVETDPRKRVDLAQPIFSDVTDELVGTAYVDDRPRLIWRDKTFAADYEWLRGKLGDLDIGLGSSTRDERRWIIVARSDVEPGATYVFDRAAKSLTLQYRIRDKLPREHLAPVKPVRYTSSDGLEIPAYLTLPKGLEPKGLPIILLPHGGPWARDAWGYSGLVQFLANRGYAVLQPNFRGSTGYGKKFLDAGNGEWGRKMQDDVTWGARYLIAEGIADPKRVGILGGSYGGYATLAGLAFTPDVYAAGVSIVGPSNLITLLESIPPYWEAARTLFHERMGNPATPEGKAQLERQSPLNSAGKIQAPLLVIQGANDPRVKKAESDQIVVALRERGFPVEYIVAPDEGHGFARPVNNMAGFAAAERFLSKHLRGRHQEGMTPEVATRLDEITVDVKTVEMPKRVTPAGAPPAPVVPLTPGTHRYSATIAMGGQTMTMTMTQEVRQEGATWVIHESIASSMGDATDRAVLDGGSLLLRRRSVAQGPVAIEIEIKDGKAAGEMKMSGQAKPLAIDVGGDLFADGPGANLIMATLPLAEGYTTAFRNLDLQTQKVKTIELTVAGTEQVTVAAGTFDTFKLELTSPDDGGKRTIWIDKKDRRWVKAVAVVPQMNGATITAELQK